jgi:hypothetical protein
VLEYPVNAQPGVDGVVKVPIINANIPITKMTN